MTSAPATGQVAATVHLLTQAQAREQFPDLFDGDEDQPYFNELGAHGNADWQDVWPERILIVRADNGQVAVASNASNWHMAACGFEVQP